LPAYLYVNEKGDDKNELREIELEGKIKFVDSH
jgi:hypothetical protein